MVEEFENKLKQLMSGEINSFRLDSGVVWNDAKDMLEDNNFEVHEDDDDWDTNGWQVDYWTSATYKDVDYDISGSMYYGEFEIVRAE